MGVRPFFVALMLMAPVSVMASDWTIVGQGQGTTVAVDVQSIAPRGKFTKAWVIFTYDHSQQPTAFATRAFQSMKSLAVYDCTERTMAVLQAIDFTGPAGSGDFAGSFSIDLSRATFTDVVPDSNGEILLRFICSRAGKPAADPAKR